MLSHQEQGGQHSSKKSSSEFEHQSIVSALTVREAKRRTPKNAKPSQLPPRTQAGAKPQRREFLFVLLPRTLLLCIVGVLCTVWIKIKEVYTQLGGRAQRELLLRMKRTLQNCSADSGRRGNEGVGGNEILSNYRRPLYISRPGSRSADSKRVRGLLPNSLVSDGGTVSKEALFSLSRRETKETSSSADIRNKQLSSGFDTVPCSWEDEKARPKLHGHCFRLSILCSLMFLLISCLVCQVFLSIGNNGQAFQDYPQSLCEIGGGFETNPAQPLVSQIHLCNFCEWKDTIVPRAQEDFFFC